MESKSIKELKLHESTKIVSRYDSLGYTISYIVIRVHGGWIYQYFSKQTSDTSSVFVPNNK